METVSDRSNLMVEASGKPKNDMSADAMADRVNCYEIAEWLDALFVCSQTVLTLPSGKPAREHHAFDFTTLGLSLRLYRHPGGALADLNNVVLSDVVYDPARGAQLPFGLNAQSLDPATARYLLSDDVTGGSDAECQSGDFRFSYFLDDARVVELIFKPSLNGIIRCSVCRLGGEVPYSRIVAMYPKRLGAPPTVGR